MLTFYGCSGSGGEKAEPQAASGLPAAWKVIGPGGGGAQFLSTIDPQDPNHVFVRCDMTGAYVTYDGGKSWRMFNLRTVVQDFEFDPGNPNTIYASNSGLYRSDDRGVRWELVYPDPAKGVVERMVGDHADQYLETRDGQRSGRIEKVRVDPADGKRIYLGMPAPMVYSPGAEPRRSGDSVLVVGTDDRGASWRELGRVAGQEILAIFPGSWDGRPEELTVFTDRAAARISIKDGGTTYLKLPEESIQAVEGGKAAKGSVFYLLTPLKESGGTVSGGIYRSGDDGQSWTRLNSGLLDDFPVTNRLPRFAALAVCEGDPAVVYLSCSQYGARTKEGSERHFGIFKTADGGQHWSWVYRASSETVFSANYSGGWMGKSYGPDWGEYPLALGVSPTNPDICWANDFGCTYRTLDGGGSWEQEFSNTLPDESVSTRGMDVTTCYGVHFDPFDPQHIFISYTDIGAFHSFNGGESWFHAIQGVPREWHNTCYWMVFDPEVKGRAWSVWGSGHDLPRPKMFRGGNFDRFVGGVAYSEDAARSWRKSNEGMPPNTVSTHILLDPQSPSDSRTLYVCGFGKGVFKSMDGGKNWVNSSNGLGPNLNAWRLVLLPGGRLILLVARGLENRQVVDGALYASDDQAASWKKLDLPEGVNAPNDLVYDPSDPQRMYLSCWPRTVERTERGGGLLRTEDGGATWKRVFEEDAHVYAAAVDPQNPATVFINTFNSAAFRSEDRGETWHRLQGYNFKWGHRPVPDPHHPGMLYLTTFGGSVFYGPATGVPGAFEDIVDPTFTMWYGKYE
ncbi:MAG: hypothetical protein A3F83_09435 [Candidatus Glassbacteria bacterium RIFCSPLOWO2_12_FULL_58_11]|uniref:Sortilin N-terminal domain-containing protein n=1 Tax=Candidatus Glassbacteria bacterium RIFCSPLOWO2_12_FULL_58_11 TaxID=1817867 RepID=A0A1F5YL09_9BACT|nr:MAG: hypothetical protein A3F83_09435 [Candidatus Glassbacteria bacterium RIFCSPLOWO2_12_FULL_58_11]